VVAADSGRFDLNAWGFELQYFSAWEGPTILVRGGGTGTCGILFRRQGTTFNYFRSQNLGATTTFFSCWIDLRLADIDGDGVPELQGCDGKFTNCPACGREAEYNLITWKLFDGVYRRWTERGADCGRSCELAWSN
jgi:hypothetical protein